MTRKQFNESVRVNRYGRGLPKLFGVFYDWKENENGVGFRCMLFIEGTKAYAIRTAYNIFIEGDRPVNPNIQFHIAETDADRRKIPLTWGLY